MSEQPLCHCGSGQNYDACCGRYLAGQYKPATAEQLMRSRYIAYMLGDGGYLYRTQHPDYRPVDFPKPVAGAGADAPMAWRRLEILDVQDGEDDSAAEVEFKAWYRQGSGLAVLHQCSRFVRIDGEWFYTDGGINPAGHGSATGSHKPGRNHPYPCGSGKKYKKCCGLAG